MAAIARGEQVDSMSYYFRTASVITAPPGKYELLNHHCVVLASGSRGLNGVMLSVWSVT